MDLGREDRDDEREEAGGLVGDVAAMDLGREDRDDPTLCTARANIGDRRNGSRSRGPRRLQLPSTSRHAYRAAMDLGREDRDDHVHAGPT